MGLTKQYLRYAPAGTFNIIANSQSNHALITLNNQEGRFVAVGAAEHVFIWDMKLGEKVQVLSGDNAASSCIVASSNNKDLAVGYTNGLLKIFELSSGELLNIFAGHKNQITAIAFDSEGHKVASGAKDNEVIVWDVIADAGICRLSGHKDQITKIVFMNTQNILITASKDTFIKFWDLETKHCFKTLTAHKTEVWDVALLKNDQYLVSGCGDSELRVWKLSYELPSEESNDSKMILSTNPTDDDADNVVNYPLKCDYTGSILRNGRGRVVSLQSDSTGQVLVTHGTDFQIEVFMFCSNEEADIRFKKRQKKERKKWMKTTQTNDQEEDNEMTISLRDEVRRLKPVKLPEKPKSLDVVLGHAGEIRISAVLVKNSVVLYSSQLNENSEPKCLRQITHHGHHSEIRTLNFSSDDLAIVSGSGEGIKVWNKTSQTCLRTVNTEYVLSLCFVPGDRHAIAGLKNGKLLIIDISVGDILEEISAHEKELWSICITPNLRGCVTGGGDSTVKFWDFQLITDTESETNTKVLSLLHTRTLKLEETVLCVKLSPNNKFIAVALLDCSVKIFFYDSLKFYLTLYGHKLPVLCMDISYDSNIIATGSADRNVKIWGLDFGDCHKSLFAHNDSVTGLQFIPNTHYFFTCGRDGKIKQWDADSYDKIITLPGHIGEAWTLAISPNGKLVLSSGSDYTLRLWERTDEIVVLEDNLDEELEDMEQLATGEETVVPGKGTVSLPSKKTVGSEKAAELIMECLEVSLDYKLTSPSSVPPLMQAFQTDNVDDFIMAILKNLRSSDLEESLLLLPFSTVCQLLEFLPPLAARGDNIELIIRVTVLLLRVHSKAIQSSSKVLQTLGALHKVSFLSAQKLRDMIGYNMHSLSFLQRELELVEGIQLFRNATTEFKEKSRKSKQRQRRKRVLMSVG